MIVNSNHLSAQKMKLNTSIRFKRQIVDDVMPSVGLDFPLSYSGDDNTHSIPYHAALPACLSLLQDTLPTEWETIRNKYEIPDGDLVDWDTLEVKEDHPWWNSSTCKAVFVAVSIRLSEVAPAYTYFGINEGVKRLGFWVDWDRIKEDISSGRLRKVSELSEIPSLPYQGETPRIPQSEDILPMERGMESFAIHVKDGYTRLYHFFVPTHETLEDIKILKSMRYHLHAFQVWEAVDLWDAPVGWSEWAPFE